jgi:hypothetical protein
VSGHPDVRIQEVPVPEPDLTPEAVIARARTLIPAIRDQQDEAERLGHPDPTRAASQESWTSRPRMLRPSSMSR